MAKRPAWTIRNGHVVREEFDFSWNSGFALSQKQKNIRALHHAIMEKTGETALEISTKSTVELGTRLSAFTLKLNDIFLENIFQAAKKYENGGPYQDLLSIAPKDAKKDERHNSSGRLISFVMDGIEWPLEAKTAFYDYLYVSAVVERFGWDLNLEEYSWFTDIEFNPLKAINCQARAITLYKLLHNNMNVDVMKEKDQWIRFHLNNMGGEF